ncbi:hypothetical protein [Amycolatopsis sp. NBC_01286]|uniref:hypothetical protein n=1 Tax=Amycolatopsis sp. NBC_01286 TaxID=2903560 RepID=UPI002E0E7EA0|nr:hypothetical protein OG570_36780 [Amycolatopsis sp. NBC_01286]
MASPRQSVSVLAGMVSHEAEHLYNRLRLARSMPSAIFQANGEAAAELLERGLVFRQPGADRVAPVGTTLALRVLLEDQQARLVEGHERMVSGWDRLISLAAETVPAGPAAGVRVLDDPHEIADRAAVLHASPRRLLRAVEIGDPASWWSRKLVRVGRAGAFRRLIHEGDTPPVPDRPGAEVRSCARLTIRMVHVDDAVALVSADRAGGSASLVRDPALLAVLGDWFDLVWASRAIAAEPARTAATSELPADVARVLAMMPFDDDETIARKTGVSVSTVRRKVRQVYGALQVDNRFAAGVAAARRGWI